MSPDSLVRPLTVALCCVLLGTTPISSAAQASDASPSPIANGVWWEVAASIGGSRLTCSLCDPDRGLGPSVDVAVGAYASPRTRVGVDGGAATQLDGAERETVYRAGLVTHLHPDPSRGFHLLGGIGWSGYRAEGFTYDAVRLTVGVGWDLALTPAWRVGNRLTLDAASFARLRNDGVTVAPSAGLSVLRFGAYIRAR